jgi:Skp family chaperone for outer membrane proteins
MKATDLLEKIQTLLSAKVNLAEMTLENGTILEAESFATGESVFIKTDDERVALPIGEYTLEDGRLLVVEEEGVIAEIKEVEAEPEMPAEELAEVEVEVEPESYDSPKQAEQVEDVLQAVVEAIAPEIEKIQEEVAEMKKELEAVKMEYKKKEEMARQKPAAKPMKHSPEASKTPTQTKLATRRARTTMDIVMEKLNR